MFAVIILTSLPPSYGVLMSAPLVMLGHVPCPVRVSQRVSGMDVGSVVIIHLS